MSKQSFGPATWALLAGVVALGAIGASVQSWQFMLTVALGKGVVAIGVALLLRSGLASFGQALYYAVGAYTIGLATNLMGWHELALLLPAAAAAGRPGRRPARPRHRPCAARARGRPGWAAAG